MKHYTRAAGQRWVDEQVRRLPRATLADLIRAQAHTLGVDLGHVPDDELGARLVAMPLDVSDELAHVLTWLVYGTPDGPSRAVGQFTSHHRARGSG